MNDRLQTALRQLRLSGLSESLAIRLQEAASHKLSHVEFLELVLQDELLVRNQRQIDRRVKTASFREVKPLDDFDWSFNPSISRKQVFDLASRRRSAISPSSKDSSSCIARSSMSCATSCTMSCPSIKRSWWPAISNRTC